MSKRPRDIETRERRLFARSALAVAVLLTLFYWGWSRYAVLGGPLPGSCVILGMELLTPPGVTSVPLIAEVRHRQTGQPVVGTLVSFRRDGIELGQAHTDPRGRAQVREVFPQPGTFVVEASIVGIAGTTRGAPTTRFRVFVPGPQDRLAVVSAPGALLATSGPAEAQRPAVPADGAVEALQAVARRFLLVYITALDGPDYLALSQWLRQHEFPLGPLLRGSPDATADADPAPAVAMLPRLRQFGFPVAWVCTADVNEARMLGGQGVPTVLVSSEVSPAQLPAAVRVVADWGRLTEVVSPLPHLP